MNEELLYEQTDGVVTLTINNPEARNPLSEAVIEGLVNAADRINADNSVRCVILTGAGKAFSAGGNVKHMRDKVGIFGEPPNQMRESYRNGIQKIPKSFYNLEVPTIAAVNGAAIGAGFDLVCMCDMRIASEHAKFAESFVKLGIVPGDGGAWFLPRAIGRSRAAEMTFTGDVIDASTALEWGLVSRVVSGENLMGEAKALAARVSVNPPHSLRLAKKLMREGEQASLNSLLELSAAFQALAHHTQDHSEAVNAFFEHRTGHFRGN